MNLINRSIFKGMKTALEKHMEAVKGILAEYVQETTKEKEVSKKFVDADGYYKEKQTAAINKARSALEREYKDIRASLKSDAYSMKKSLKDYLAEPMNDNFITKLKVYNDFGIKLTRTELESLLALNQGNPVGLRALAHVLESTHTPWKVNYRDLGSLEEDVAKVERIAGTMTYTPVEDHIAACEILKGTPVLRMRDDGSTYSSSTHDSVSILMESGTVTGFYENIEEMEKAWIADVTTPAISKASKTEASNLNELDNMMRKEGVPEKYLDHIDTDPESTVSVESDPAAKLIEELRQEASRNKYDETMAKYVK
jgi:hypothetical protein